MGATGTVKTPQLFFAGEQILCKLKSFYSSLIVHMGDIVYSRYLKRKPKASSLNADSSQLDARVSSKKISYLGHSL